MVEEVSYTLNTNSTHNFQPNLYSITERDVSIYIEKENFYFFFIHSNEMLKHSFQKNNHIFHL